MPDASDMELLRDYDRQGSEAAFAELVRRHIHLVYSVAVRHVGMAAHAEEITQAVFIILARKAAGLRPDTILEGWLHETTRLTALSFLRGERRRQFREQEAYMQSTLQESPEDAVWHQLAPLLDEAMCAAGQKGPRRGDAAVFQGQERARSGGGHAGERAGGATAGACAPWKSCGNSSPNAAWIPRRTPSPSRFPPIPFKPRPVALGKSRDCRGDCQRRGGFNFNLNPHQRSIENYGMDKSENGDCCWRSSYSGCNNDIGCI